MRNSTSSSPTFAPPAAPNDTWIAACCLVDDLPLATFNIKDFADFAEHEGLTLIGGQEP
jgi:toxin FitB